MKMMGFRCRQYRHSPDSYSWLRNDSNLSSGRNFPGLLSNGIVRARIFSFSARSASRKIWVVSMDSCPARAQ